ncbi:MAG TPA: AAA family ATPase, partial [Rubrobacteraceae bacterium]|nr:AAA family ATPase [Rubrobacteraceae bacterium]
MLSAVYIKGFKTFARPVRMPLEGGLTAIVGPNGSGKSNITDAVLFAFGEQSPGVLRAGVMGDLIFSGSETLPASGVAEVTLVLDNESGEISLPYQEVSISRRISRNGDTEYRVNGSRARLADVRAVAGEAGLGRHSILRQGAVDAIVAGGAAACRLALEEAAGLGVYRRRRLSASRRLEKAQAQLDQSRQLEAELASQLRRIEREAVAAREYREVEGRYRKLSLAHLYRVADQGLDERRKQLERSEKSVVALSEQERALREEEAGISPQTQRLESAMRSLERQAEELEEAEEDLRAETMRADRALLRLESRAGGTGDRQRNIATLEAELERIERALGAMRRELDLLEIEHTRKREKQTELRRMLDERRQRQGEADRSRSRIAAELEGLRGRRERILARGTKSGNVGEEYLRELAEVSGEIERLTETGFAAPGRNIRDTLGGLRAALDERAAGINRRGGALEAALGAAEAVIRSLRDADTQDAGGPRLHEVIRARPGFEGAVEAALGDAAGGLLAANVSEGIKLLSEGEPVALRLDARPVDHYADHPGLPLLDCVELVDEEYAEAVERLLAGIYVVEDPAHDHPENGHVVVTRNGFRLTRTSVRLRSEDGRFSRKARLDREQNRLR